MHQILWQFTTPCPPIPPHQTMVAQDTTVTEVMAQGQVIMEDTDLDMEDMEVEDMVDMEGAMVLVWGME